MLLKNSFYVTLFAAVLGIFNGHGRALAQENQLIIDSEGSPACNSARRLYMRCIRTRSKPRCRQQLKKREKKCQAKVKVTIEKCNKWQENLMTKAQKAACDLLKGQRAKQKPKTARPVKSSGSTKTCLVREKHTTAPPKGQSPRYLLICEENRTAVETNVTTYNQTKTGDSISFDDSCFCYNM